MCITSTTLRTQEKGIKKFSPGGFEPVPPSLGKKKHSLARRALDCSATDSVTTQQGFIHPFK